MSNERTAGVFTGTADYYARYRPHFPDDVFAAVRTYFGLDGRGALLDLGTGTGELAFALHDSFERVVAIDLSEEMIAAARTLAAAQRAAGIAWHTAAAEDFADIDPGPFRLVTIANALHWMDQPRVLAACREHLDPGGGVAVLSLPALINIDNSAGAEPWVQETVRVIKRHLGERRRAGSGYYRPPSRNWRDELAAAGFAEVTSGRAVYAVTWSVDEIIGYLYSTSFASRAVLGDRAEAFETDLRETLVALDPSGRYPRRLEPLWVFGQSRDRRR